MMTTEAKMETVTLPAGLFKEIVGIIGGELRVNSPRAWQALLNDLDKAEVTPVAPTTAEEGEVNGD